MFRALLVAFAFVLTACVLGYEVSGGLEPKQVSGKLGGDAKRNDFGSGCIWLTGPDGERVPLFVTDDTVVQFEPLRLVDAAGRVIASDGDTVTAIGPSMALGENGCAPIDDMFVVDELIGPGGRWLDATSIRFSSDPVD